MWNARRGRALALTVLSGGLWLGGCKQSNPPIQPSIFTNPKEVTLVCFSADESAEDPTLPLECCDGVLGDDAEATDKAERCGWQDGKLAAVSHALVTQVQRGEVAAVDLERHLVLDSDKRIPGYTFVDVGGLPTAIAVRKGSAGEPPLWTYVAGRERNSLRAVATCRFKTGKECGPELAGQETERALAGEPFDMLLAADERALWVTLPDAGLLAYVPLPAAADDEAPFAGDVIYYPLPGGIDTKPPAPTSEPEPYRFACRFDESQAGDGGIAISEEEEVDGVPTVEPDMSDPAPWDATELKMPTSQHAESTRTARPTLLRMVDLNPRGESDPTRKMLFVADEEQMALHAYTRDAAGNLALVASMPVGAPLRDFAITPEVPALAPSYARLLTDTYYDEPRATVRYAYAIDQRDGSLMAFSLRFEAGVPKLLPLLAPTPARDTLRQALNRADRLSLGGGSQGAQARALEVVDTRLHRRADGSFDDGHCHVDDRTKELSDLDSAADDAQRTFEDDPRPPHLRDWQLAADALAVPTNAGAFALRGVFLMVATTNGQFSVLDIHDLDLECRTKLQCPAEPETEGGVVIARHTPRMSGTKVPTIGVSPADEVELLRDCPDDGDDSRDGYELRPDRDEKNRVCVSKDAWLAQSLTFSVGYEAAISGVIPDGVLTTDEDGQLLLKAPQGIDLCARGANADDKLLVGILTPPDDAKKSGGRCEVTSFTSQPRLRVLKAQRDQLVLEPEDDKVDAETLLACYRELVSFELRLDDQYLVRSDSVGYQHRNMGAPEGMTKPDGTIVPEGTCITNEALDERFTSRATLDKPFKNQFLSFKLTAKGVTVDAGAPSADAGGTDAGEDEEDGGAADEDEEELSDTEIARRREVNPTITISTEVGQVASSVAGANASRGDVLPHRVRYFPEGNYLFVVDQASQGLRRFLLRPRFAPDSESIF